jgi:hypothetical protein
MYFRRINTSALVTTLIRWLLDGPDADADIAPDLVS